MKRMNSCLCVIVFILLSAISVKAQSVSAFKESIYIAEKGGASVVWSLTTAPGDSVELLLPWNFKEKPDAKIKFSLFSAPDNKPIETEPVLIVRKGSLFVLVPLMNKMPAGSYRIEFKVNEFQNLDREKAEEFGNYPFKYRFINTTLPNIKDFESRIYLPERFVIASVDETIPKQTEDNPVSPFTLGSSEGKNHIKIATPLLKLGDHIYVKMNVKREEKPITTLIVFAAAGLLYLFFFRELVSKKNGNDNSENKNNA